PNSIIGGQRLKSSPLEWRALLILESSNRARKGLGIWPRPSLRTASPPSGWGTGGPSLWHRVRAACKGQHGFTTRQDHSNVRPTSRRNACDELVEDLDHLGTRP